jgi:hypothetical protein
LRRETCTFWFSLVLHRPGATQTLLPPAVSLPFRVLLPKVLLVTSRCERLSWGSSCRLAHPFLGVHIPPGVPSPRLRSASRDSHPLCGLFLPGLASLFHPAKAHRLHPSGVSPPKELRQLFAGSLPSCRCSRVALPPSRRWVHWRTVRSASRSGASAFGSTSRLCSP